jgi:hypothetical protein
LSRRSQARNSSKNAGAGLEFEQKGRPAMGLVVGEEACRFFHLLLPLIKAFAIVNAVTM